MIHRAIRVRDWVVDVLFAYPRNDPEGVLACLQSFEAPDRVVQDAVSLMKIGPNTGFTFSNGYRRRILTWVGPQSEGKQWLNTTVHEIVHVAFAVARDHMIDPYSEEFAYLIGDITQELSDLVCFLACDKCRDDDCAEEKNA